MATQESQRKQAPYPSAQILPPLNPFLGLLPRSLWNRVKDFFIYSVEWLPLAASAMTPATFEVDGSAGFQIISLARVVTATDNTTVLAFPPFLVRIEDSGSGRNLMNIACHIENMAGSAQLPGIWPFPKTLPPNTQVSITLQNLSATAYNVRMAFAGFKVFGMEQGK